MPKNFVQQLPSGGETKDNNEVLEMEDQDYKNVINSLGDYSNYLSITHDASLSDDEYDRSLEYEGSLTLSIFRSCFDTVFWILGYKINECYVTYIVIHTYIYLYSYIWLNMVIYSYI